MGDKIFTYPDILGPRGIQNLLKKTKHSTSYYGEAGEGLQFVYNPSKSKGPWFLSSGGMGPIQEKSLHALGEILREK